MAILLIKCGKTGNSSVPSVYRYLRPDGVSFYRRPDSTSFYKRP